MESESKKCVVCSGDFVIELEDFKFYEKAQVPPPTRCPDCRLKRRIATRNERTFYKVKCQAPGHEEELLSIYPKSRVVYDQQFWWSDGWDPLDYGREYDFSRSFFEQFADLEKEVPIYNMYNRGSINCEYCAMVADSKNCYLSVCREGENCNYIHAYKAKDSMDLYFSVEVELCYECVNVESCYHTFFSQYGTEISDSVLVYDGVNLQNCLGCVNLRNKKYCILNKEYSKEDYEKKRQELDLGSYKNLEKFKEEFRKFRLTQPHRFANIYHSTDCTGNIIYGAKNCKHSFDLTSGCEDCKYLLIAGAEIKDAYDVTNSGLKMEMAYDSLGSSRSNRIYFCDRLEGVEDAYYTSECKNSSFLFGCYGLKNKQYCILNKQYSKEEYEKLVPKIIEHMYKMPYTDKAGNTYTFGEYLPPELSSYGYNITVAGEYFPMEREEAVSQGYKWDEDEEKTHQVTVAAGDLPDHIKDVDDSILKEAIGCEHEGKCQERCTKAFRIIPSELDFYRRMNLPLPRFCPNCRHFQRLRRRTPPSLRKGRCRCAGAKSDNEVYQNELKHFHGEEHCPNEFETSFPEGSPEILYCEPCYQDETS